MNPTCAICQTPTNGLFMPAKEIVAKLKQQDQLKQQLNTSVTKDKKDQTSSDNDDDNAESSWLFIAFIVAFYK